MHAGLRTETSALRDVVGAMVGRMDQLVDCQNALQRQVPVLIAAFSRHSSLKCCWPLLCRLCLPGMQQRHCKPAYVLLHLVIDAMPCNCCPW
jgi:hypothetical protein